MLTVLLCLLALPVFAQQGEKPLNFLMIWGDDIGYWNISAYNMGMMGYKTPNIDRFPKDFMFQLTFMRFGVCGRNLRPLRDATFGCGLELSPSTEF